MLLRRARGALLRLVRRRSLAIAVGAALVAPAWWLKYGSGMGAWWTEGLGLLLAATGAALIWTGLAGAGPDWVDENDRPTRKP